MTGVREVNESQVNVGELAQRRTAVGVTVAVGEIGQKEVSIGKGQRKLGAWWLG